MNNLGRNIITNIRDIDKRYQEGFIEGVTFVVHKEKIHIQFYIWMDSLNLDFLSKFSDQNGILDYDHLSEYYFENIYK